MSDAVQYQLDEVRVTVVCENTAVAEKTLGEQGLAILVECPAGSVLLDTGGGQTLLHNADQLRLDLARVDAVVISHGHHDHSGGLADLLELRGAVEVFGHPDIFRPRYSLRDGQEPRASGLQLAQAEYAARGARWRLSAEAQTVLPGIWLTGGIARRNDFEWQDEGFRFDADGSGRLEMDPIPDDQGLVVSTTDGLIVVSGCAHAGPVAMVRQAMEQAPGRPLLCLLGGLHLRRASEERLRLTARALRHMDVRSVWAGHCTGFPAQLVLAREFASEFSPLGTGVLVEPIQA